MSATELPEYGFYGVRLNVVETCAGVKLVKVKATAVGGAAGEVMERVQTEFNGYNHVAGSCAPPRRPGPL